MFDGEKAKVVSISLAEADEFDGELTKKIIGLIFPIKYPMAFMLLTYPGNRNRNWHETHRNIIHFISD